MLKAGEAANPVRLWVGDYERWFQRALGGEARLEVLRVSQGANPPRTLDGYDALMMTGSPLSVASPTDWMIRSTELLKKAGDRGLPGLSEAEAERREHAADARHALRDPGHESSQRDSVAADAAAGKDEKKKK